MKRRPDLDSFRETPLWEWPGNAGKLFLEVLTDRDASAAERLTAARLAGDFTVVNDELCDALLDIVGNAAEPDQLRGAAAIAFGAALEQGDLFGFEDPDDVRIGEPTFERILATLHALYSDPAVPVLVRRGALEGSVRAPQDWHTAAIAEAYSSGDRDWMLSAVFAMRWVPGFDELILQALESPDPAIQSEAVEAAGAQEVEAARGHIVALIEDDATPKPLLLAAMEALGNIAPSEVRDILGDLLDSDDEEIAEAAEEAIDTAEALDSDEFEEDDDEEEEVDRVN